MRDVLTFKHDLNFSGDHQPSDELGDRDFTLFLALGSRSSLHKLVNALLITSQLDRLAFKLVLLENRLGGDDADIFHRDVLDLLVASLGVGAKDAECHGEHESAFVGGWEVVEEGDGADDGPVFHVGFEVLLDLPFRLEVRDCRGFIG